MFRFMKQPLNGHINEYMYKYWFANNKNIFVIKNKMTCGLKHQQTGRDVCVGFVEFKTDKGIRFISK